MKIGIISDVHDNLVNLKEVLNYCADNRIKQIICCGDLASAETLSFLLNNFQGKVFFVFGNMDREHLEFENLKIEHNNSNIKIFEDFGSVEIARKKIAFTHFPDVAKKLCETSKYNFVFYGHTHKPWEEIIGRCKMLNPGNVAGDIYPATFAIWDTDEDIFKLKRVY